MQAQKEPASEEIKKLMRDVRSWADQSYGRRAELARILGVSKQVISDWLTGRSTPSFEKGLKLIAFLESQKTPK
jgi:DNA-binding transcriptional regulator YiaG